VTYTPSLQTNLIPEIPVLAPTLALLGDIGYPSQKRYQDFIKKQSKRFKQVFIIAGNHEYYTSEYNEVKEEIRELCENFKNVIFLDRSKHRYTDPDDENYTVTILGCTLWSFIPPDHETEISNCSNDYYKINIVEEVNGERNRRLLTVPDTNKWHKEEVE
jgi:hypothetical protein